MIVKAKIGNQSSSADLAMINTNLSVGKLYLTSGDLQRPLNVDAENGKFDLGYWPYRQISVTILWYFTV